jgi:hypothetical protein
MQAAVGMYGDLQGITGKSLEEIDGFGLDTTQEPPAMIATAGTSGSA